MHCAFFHSLCSQMACISCGPIPFLSSAATSSPKATPRHDQDEEMEESTPCVPPLNGGGIALSPICFGTMPVQDLAFIWRWNFILRKFFFSKFCCHKNAVPIFILMEKLPSRDGRKTAGVPGMFEVNFITRWLFEMVKLHVLKIILKRCCRNLGQNFSQSRFSRQTDLSADRFISGTKLIFPAGYFYPARYSHYSDCSARRTRRMTSGVQTPVKTCGLGSHWSVLKRADAFDAQDRDGCGRIRFVTVLLHIRSFFVTKYFMP